MLIGPFRVFSLKALDEHTSQSSSSNKKDKLSSILKRKPSAQSIEVNACIHRLLQLLVDVRKVLLSAHVL